MDGSPGRFEVGRKFLNGRALEREAMRDTPAIPHFDAGAISRAEEFEITWTSRRRGRSERNFGLGAARRALRMQGFQIAHPALIEHGTIASAHSHFGIGVIEARSERAGLAIPGDHQQPSHLSGAQHRAV